MTAPRILAWPETRPDLTPSLQGWLMPEVQWGLRALGAEARTIVEIGSHHGLSARFMAAMNPTAKVYCVDPWETWGGGIFPSSPEIFFASCWEFRERIEAVRGRSPEALRYLRDLDVIPDLVYIDGDHSEAACAEDLRVSSELWPKAILCGDDFATENPGVMAAVTKFADATRRLRWTSGRFWRVA